MKKDKITTISRAILFICGCGVLLVLFTPLWRIDLVAPQYPEGLQLLIHANKLSGNVDIINGLNHYIGMKKLVVDDFPEFKILPGIIVFFSILFIVTGFAGRRKWVYTTLSLFVIFGILAMADFWRWEYDYGHHLNPDAAIVVPGMAYQPPLIGFKQLLNFGAWSFPDVGGWIFISVGLLLLLVTIFEWTRMRKSERLLRPAPAMAMVMLTMLLASCNTAPEPIRTGQDNCAHCKMTVSDNRFGAEIITAKGKIYKFDDTHCMQSFMQSALPAGQKIAGTYFTDFNSPHELIPVDKAFLLQSPALKTPMNGHIAAFSNEAGLQEALKQFNGKATSWKDLQP